MLDAIEGMARTLYVPLGDEPQGMQVMRHPGPVVTLGTGICLSNVRFSLHMSPADARALGEALIQMAGG